MKPIKLSKEEKTEKMFSWFYNVKDKFKSKTTEEIVNELQLTHQPFAVMMAQIVGDFNIGSVFRSANSFNAKECFYYGSRKYDKRSTCGVHNYTKITHLQELKDIIALKEKYSFVGLENCHNPVNLNTFSWDLPKMPLIIIGEESCGISPEIIELCDVIVEIPSYGSVRSLNAASAASIAIYDFCAKKGNR